MQAACPGSRAAGSDPNCSTRRRMAWIVRYCPTGTRVAARARVEQELNRCDVNRSLMLFLVFFALQQQLRDGALPFSGAMSQRRLGVRVFEGGSSPWIRVNVPTLMFGSSRALWCAEIEKKGAVLATPVPGHHTTLRCRSLCDWLSVESPVEPFSAASSVPANLKGARSLSTKKPARTKDGSCTRFREEVEAA